MEEDLTVVSKMCCRFPVGDHHDLACPVVASEHPTSEQERVVHVRPVHVVPGNCRQLFRADLPGRSEKPTIPR